MRRVVSNPVSLEEFQKLLFKTLLRVMCRLVLDIPNDVAGLRGAHAERAVTLLPRKSAAISFSHFDELPFRN